MFAPLLASLAQYAVLNTAEAALAEQCFHPLTLRRHDVAEPAGAVPQYLYFVLSGYLRLSEADPQGREATSYLAGPGDFVTCFHSFIQQRLAPDTLAAITDAQLLRIARSDLQALVDTSLAFRQCSLRLFEHAFATIGHRAHGLATRTATARYQHLLATRPDLALHVPVHELASYLGVHPESLSRIRRQVSS